MPVAALAVMILRALLRETSFGREILISNLVSAGHTLVLPERLVAAKPTVAAVAVGHRLQKDVRYPGSKILMALSTIVV